MGTGVILAVDPGSTCGWAVGGIDAQILSGIWDIRPRRGESPGMRYVRLRARLEEVLRAYPRLGVVVYEQAHHRGGHATEYAHGCVATIQAWCAERGIEHASVHAATLKKHAVGNGRASKAEMIRAARERFGCRVHDDNEADALWILDWAMAAFQVRRG